MAEIEAFLSEASAFVWGPVMLALLLGTGVYLTVGLRFVPVRKLAYAVGLLVSGRRDHGRAKARGEISPFQALMVAVSGQVGTGNIAGVATAIFFGGPGAIFWMWITALVGMATQYSEALLAVHYRSRTEEGHYVGGPMHYIQKGLHRRWHWLAPLFALFGTVAAFGIGNAVQANSVAHVFEEWLTVPRAATGLALAAVVFIVVVGGVRRIAHWAEALVPTMAGVYIVGALAILALNAGAIPEVVVGIFRAAFTGEAAAGGAAGGGVWLAIRFGVARGVFSNEAGLGSTPIAHAAAQTPTAVRQGLIAMLGTFMDTIIICSMTALAILVTGAQASGLNGAALSAKAFHDGLPGAGDFVVSFGLVLFAFTTLLAWSYYGERCIEFLLGKRAIFPYRLAWVAMAFAGAVADLKLVWLFSDVMNGLMAVPNLIALLLLSPLVFRASRDYFAANDRAGGGGQGGARPNASVAPH